MRTPLLEKPTATIEEHKCIFCGSKKLSFEQASYDNKTGLYCDTLTEDERNEADFTDCLGHTIIRCKECNKHWWRTDEKELNEKDMVKKRRGVST